ncbi:hypothetical protein CFC35_15340 [Streptomyces sp. FBKL.4005]|nr:hypothetical protein CFC35_15340 [Streptomyces sp. FBKL.4005]
MTLWVRSARTCRRHPWHPRGVRRRARPPVPPAARDEDRLPVGQLAHDARRERRGIVMDHLDGFVWLRPVGGGTEWTALPGDVRPMDVRKQEALLRARVASANARSRGELL